MNDSHPQKEVNYLKALKQLLRQPLKSGIGLLLMTLAAAIVCLCVGQAMAAKSTEETLNKQFSTVGIPLVQESMEGFVTQGSFLVEDEFFAWQQNLAIQRPDIVKQVAQHGMLSVYIPELVPLNFTQQKRPSYTDPWYFYQPFHEMMPYTCAMLVITLEEISEPVPVTASYQVEDLTADDFASQSDYYAWIYDNPDTEKVSVTQGYAVNLSGTVTEVVSLAEGYRDPVGRVARLTFYAPTLEEANALKVEPGLQYIIYGMDYSDEHWKLISALNPDGFRDYLDLEHYKPELVRFLTEEELRENAMWAEAFPEEMGNLKYLVAAYDTLFITELEYLQLNAISMSLATPVPLVQYEEIRDELTGNLLDLRPATEVSYTDSKGETVTYSFDEYTSRYRIPTIARLDGTVQDFLNSEAGEPWQAALEQSAVNHQSFLVMGVDKMDYLADFSLQRSQIVAGRAFSDEELKNGSRVCIIHDTLAEANGITLGDTITLNLYESDAGLPYQQEKGILNPAASFYFDTTPFTETEEYTVVGIWRGERLWPDVAEVSEYAFSPNTIFVPKSSVQTPMEFSNSIIFNTIVLQNAKIEEFHELAMNSGYAGRFKYNDQGYSTIATNFHNYDALAQQMLTVGVVVYVVLLMLFLFFYPCAQRKTVMLMQSFGAGYFRRFWFVCICSLGIVIPGSVLGGFFGNVLWDYVVMALQTSAESAVALQIQPGVLTQLALTQMLLAVIATVIVSIFVAVPRGMSSRR